MQKESNKFEYWPIIIMRGRIGENMSLRWFFCFSLAILLLSVPVRNTVSYSYNEGAFHFVSDGLITLMDTHSGKKIDVRYKDKHGYYTPDGVEVIFDFMRCRKTGERIPIALNLIELLDHMQDHFGGREIQIVSAYRSPRLNGNLRRSGHRVAKNSYHMKGMAIDFRMPGISNRQIRNYAMAIKSGGIGYYGRRNFIHLDVGPFRMW